MVVTDEEKIFARVLLNWRALEIKLLVTLKKKNKIAWTYGKFCGASIVFHGMIKPWQSLLQALFQAACTVMASFWTPNCLVWLLLGMWLHLAWVASLHRLHRDLKGLPQINFILHLWLNPGEATPAESWPCTHLLWHSQRDKGKISTGNKEKIRIKRLKKNEGKKRCRGMC